MCVPTKASGLAVTEYFSFNNRDTINTGQDLLPPLLLAAQMNRCGAVNAQQRECTPKKKKKIGKKIQHGGPQWST